MSEKQIRAMLQDIAEQKAPATEIDLWWNIQARLEQAPLRTGDRNQLRGFTMQTPKQQYRLSYVAFAILAIMLAGGIFFVTPRGRALAQEILHFFTRSSSDTFQVPTQAPLKWVEQTPGLPMPTMTSIPTEISETECGAYQTAHCSVEQIRSKVKFTVKELAVIPEGMVFIGATDGPDGVFIHYDTPYQTDQSGAIILFERPWTDDEDPTNWKIGASAVVDKINIGSSTGEYVKGIFSYQDGDTEGKWDANADVQRLRWIDQGVSILLEYSGMQLSKEEFISLAMNLTSEPVSATSAPAPQTTEPISEDAVDFHSLYPLTVDEAQAQAGFKLPQPSRLPEILTLIGASFEPKFNSVKVFYLRSQDIGYNTDGLVLTVEPISATETSNNCGFTIGNKEDYAKNPPSENPHLCEIKIVGDLEEVKIGDISGQYSQGVWSGTDQGWVWDATPYLKQLRWQKDGFAFELMYMGMEISKEDMIAIALSIK
jgi:hypothetical protein